VKLFQAKLRLPWIVIKLISLSRGISNDFEKRDLLFLKQRGRSTIALTKNKVTDDLLKNEKVRSTSSPHQSVCFSWGVFFKGKFPLKEVLNENSTCWSRKSPLSATNQSLILSFSYKLFLNFFKKRLG
jgi:hypothetical protein|tara:strand:- start:2526 stop:2909 length:384 start_codon:yes stop_codon:yes gene_type:complete